MKKVLLLGATGMLGSAAYDALKDSYELILTMRSKEKIALLEHAYGGTAQHRVLEFDATALRAEPSYLEQFIDEAGAVDHVINAIGMTRDLADADPPLAYFVNGEFPHILSRTFGGRLIHIATNGVYDGAHGPYDERSPKSPVGTYALSKSQGEPEGSLVLRTSIIGRELEHFTGLIEWFLGQKGKSVQGFAQQYWNGITAKEFGSICDRIMSTREQFPPNGIYHVFSNTLSKYDMLCAFREKWNVDCEIIRDEEHPLDQTLATLHDLNAKLAIPTFQSMLASLQ